MAQNTAGVRLVYGTATIANGVVTPPSTWAHIPGITGFPAMGGAPEALESTTTDDLTHKAYIAGLIDLGGMLEFTANHTPALITAVTTALTANCFAIEYPEPLSERYYWLGAIEPIAPGAVETNQVVTTTVYISQETGPTRVAVTAP